MVKTSIRTGWTSLDQPVGDVDNYPPGTLVDDEDERDEGTVIELQEVTGRVRDEGCDRAEGSSVCVFDRGADQFVHPQGVGLGNRFGEKGCSSQTFCVGAVGDVLEGDDPSLLERPRRRHGENSPGRGGETGPLSEALGAVRDEIDDHLTAKTVWLRDGADLEQGRRSAWISNRRRRLGQRRIAF
jgi:hypothetical protein